jgi:pimeloyl-ACP methyl ester carboxylesterase
MYFDPAAFKECHNRAFLKWRRMFEESSDSQMSKVTGWYEIDRDGRDLRELMRLPPETAQEDDGQKMGVIQCLGRGCLYEGNPQAAMTYLYRGKHVILFNYRGMGLSEGSPGYLETCHDALAVTDWMHEKLNCKSNQLVIQGFSMGSGPAVYAASRTPNLDLIVDRGFSRLSAVKVSWCLERAFKYMAENFYPYPNDELLPQVTGRVLIIQAENDLLIDGSHAARLFEILAVAKLGPDASEDAIESFRAKTWVVVNGGHNSKCCGDEDYAWYAHGPSQKKVSGFFID